MTVRYEVSHVSCVFPLQAQHFGRMQAGVIELAVAVKQDLTE